jgi:hypothetical protein
MSEPRYLVPKNQPPSREDYDELYAQFIALILATGKTSVTVPHSIRHPMNPSAGVLVVKKEVGGSYTTYYVEQAP